MRVRDRRCCPRRRRVTRRRAHLRRSRRRHCALPHRWGRVRIGEGPLPRHWRGASRLSAARRAAYPVPPPARAVLVPLQPPVLQMPAPESQARRRAACSRGTGVNAGTPFRSFRATQAQFHRRLIGVRYASTNLRADSRRCGHPGQQQGRFFPSRTSSCSRARRFSRVASCLADRVQQIHSFLASGVSASHFADSEASPSSIALSSGVSWWRKSGSAAFATPLQAALASSISIRSQISTRADTRSSIMAGVCAGPGVKRSRSVPRGTVGKLIGCT